MSLHSDLIAELLSRKTSMTPRENAAANEIERLLALLAGEDKAMELSDAVELKRPKAKKE
jgi:hypothetical protein